MSKQKIIDRIAASGVSKVEADRMIKSVIDAIEAELADSGSVQFVGFATFSVVERAARTGRNPATGETIHIPPKKAVTFRAGNKLTQAIA